MIGGQPQELVDISTRKVSAPIKVTEVKLLCRMLLCNRMLMICCKIPVPLQEELLSLGRLTGAFHYSRLQFAQLHQLKMSVANTKRIFHLPINGYLTRPQLEMGLGIPRNKSTDCGREEEGERDTDGEIGGEAVLKWRRVLSHRPRKF
ncbi:hypothetical protein LOD99_5263 [Oopsacas minuta]|uniref:Uncharacterized protein n=1 Tax=Oopsacas minuta TaxID=111878 RepID=A0AAV7JRD6_9METZ|nr:hypothetical protein LOD99_5263 [Oopsacas minuta]